VFYDLKSTTKYKYTLDHHLHPF